jgi:hypothetical protein
MQANRRSGRKHMCKHGMVDICKCWTMALTDHHKHSPDTCSNKTYELTAENMAHSLAECTLPRAKCLRSGSKWSALFQHILSWTTHIAILLIDNMLDVTGIALQEVGHQDS